MCDNIEPADESLARSGGEKPRKHFDGTRFARAVGTEKAQMAPFAISKDREFTAVTVPNCLVNWGQEITYSFVHLSSVKHVGNVNACSALRLVDQRSLRLAVQSRFIGGFEFLIGGVALAAFEVGIQDTERQPQVPKDGRDRDLTCRGRVLLFAITPRRARCQCDGLLQIGSAACSRGTVRLFAR